MEKTSVLLREIDTVYNSLRATLFTYSKRGVIEHFHMDSLMSDYSYLKKIVLLISEEELFLYERTNKLLEEKLLELSYINNIVDEKVVREISAYLSYYFKNLYKEIKRDRLAVKLKNMLGIIKYTKG